jgi:hypothetical protein
MVLQSASLVGVDKSSSMSWRPERSGVEPPFVFGNGNKRWLDFARHDSLICLEIHAGGPRFRAALFVADVGLCAFIDLGSDFDDL